MMKLIRAINSIIKYHATILLFLLIIFITWVKSLFLTTIPLFGDEALYCYLGLKFNTQPFTQAFDTTVNLFKDAPLLPLMNAISLKIVGQTNPVIACRLVSVVLSGFGAICFYFFLKKLISESQILFLAPLLLMLNPYSFFFDRTSLMDAPLVFWSLLFIYLTLSFMDKGNLSLLVLTMASFLAMFFTKYNSLIILPWLVLIILMKNTKKSYRIYYFLTLSVFVIGIILTTYFFTHTWETIFYHVNTSLNFKDLLLRFLKNTKVMFVWYSQFLTPFSFILSVIGVYFAYRRSYLKLIIFVPFVIMTYALVLQNIFPRYLLLTLPFIALIISLISLSKIGIYGLVILFFTFMINDYLILTKPDTAKLATQTRFEYWQDWGSGVGTNKLINYLGQNSIFKNAIVFIPTDLEGLFVITKKQFQPNAKINFKFVNNGEDFINKLSNSEKKNTYVVSTPFHEKLTQTIKQIKSSRLIYTSNGTARNSVLLYAIPEKFEVNNFLQ